jgi:DNA polymerase phi
LFGLNVLLESEILFRQSTSSEAITSTITGLFELALKKTWLREPASKAICSLIISLPRFTDPQTVSKTIQHNLDESGLLQSQDGAAILLVLHSLPKELRPTANKIWHHADPLHTSNLSLLTKVLKESSSEDDTVKHTGNFKGEAHFIWMFILRRYIEKSKEIIPFERLWKTVVESISPPSLYSHFGV